MKLEVIKMGQRWWVSDRRPPYNANSVGNQDAQGSEENCAFSFAATENQGETCSAIRLKELYWK